MYYLFNKHFLHALIAVGIMIGLAACGQTGPLSLPPCTKDNAQPKPSSNSPLHAIDKR